jgi:hypothetical protein
VLSVIDVIFGAYGDGGRDDLGAGIPKPDIPPTLYLLEFGWRCRLEDEVEAGGVFAP